MLKRNQPVIVITVVTLLFFAIGFSAAQDAPISKDTLVRALKQLRPGDSQAPIIKIIRTRGVGFDLTEETKKELTNAGATPALIDAVRANYRKPTPEPSPVATPHFAVPPGYHVAKTFKLGGEGGWDYLTVDSKVRRVYISRSTHVMVVDADTGAIIGDIPNTSGVHGIALADEFDKGFISDGRDNNVTIFDIKTLKVLGTAATGKNPDAIIYDPVSKRVFTFNGASHDVTAIDARTGTVAGTIPLGGKPEAAVADEKGHVFVNIEDTSEIVRFDANKLSVENRWKISPCEDPTGLALNRRHRRLFAVCGNKMMVIVNADDGKVVTTVPIGAGSDGAAFDSETGLAFSTNGGDGTLTVVHQDLPDKYTAVENVPTLPRARTIALDPKTHQVYTITAEFGQASAPIAGQRPPRAPMVPGTFTLLILSR